jgi:1-acyl-sn-glycerol-3-phosphate acyltransferase
MLIKILYSLYFHLFKFISTLFFSSIMISNAAIFFFSRKLRHRVNDFCAKIWGKTIVWASGIDFQVEFEAEPDPSKHYIYAGNHQSSFDIYVYYAFIPHHFYWISKKSLFYIPLLGWAMALTGHIPVARDKSDKAVEAFKKAVERAKAGTSIAIFPEGHRSPDGTLQPFKKGAFLLARLSRMDIVPIVIRNAHKVAPKGKFLLDPRHSIHVKFLEPVESRDKKVADVLRSRIKEELEQK